MHRRGGPTRLHTHRRFSVHSRSHRRRPDEPRLLMFHEQLPYLLIGHCHICLQHAVGTFPSVLGNGYF